MTNARHTIKEDPLPKVGTTKQTASSSRPLPHNIEAEESILGAAMLSPEALEICVTEVSAEDFYKPGHASVHRALTRLWEAGIIHPDPVIVGDELTPMELEAMGGWAALAGIVAITPSSSAARHYATIVVEHAVRRRLIQAGHELVELGHTSQAVHEACESAQAIVGGVEMPIGHADPSPTIAELLEEESTYDWIVPGLLERMDRLILTGGEGGGKSTMLRQLAVQLASGVHPFRFFPITPLRVLMIDLENSPNQARRKLAPMVGNMGDRLDPDRLRLEIRSEGIDLTTRQDTRWLLERVLAAKPDVLLIGPIYRMSSADPSDDQAARAVIRVLDMVRVKFGVTLVIEAHAGHGSGMGQRELRPIGSSVWKRWPEFGYGIRPDTDSPRTEDGLHYTEAMFEAWRGARDEREWPTKIKRSVIWPWEDAHYRAPTIDPERPVHQHREVLHGRAGLDF